MPGVATTIDLEADIKVVGREKKSEDGLLFMEDDKDSSSNVSDKTRSQEIAMMALMDREASSFSDQRTTAKPSRDEWEIWNRLLGHAVPVAKVHAKNEGKLLPQRACNKPHCATCINGKNLNSFTGSLTKGDTIGRLHDEIRGKVDAVLEDGHR